MLVNSQRLLLFDLCKSLGCLRLPSGLFALPPVQVAFLCELFFDLFFALEEGLSVKEGEDLAHLDEVLEFDLNLLEQGNLVSHVFLLDCRFSNQLRNRLVYAFYVVTCAALRVQILVEHRLYLTRLLSTHGRGSKS